MHENNDKSFPIISARVIICKADCDEVIRAVVNKEIDERFFTDNKAARITEVRGMIAARKRG